MEPNKNKNFINNNKNVLALLIIFLCASSLRFYGLEIQSLWVDEISTWYVSGKNDLSEVIATVRASRHEATPPGYFVLIYFVQKYVGDSEWVLRFPSAVAGVLSVLVIYLLGRRLYSPREGLIGAVLLTVLWAPIYYGQEARAYSLLLLFTLLATYFWVAVVRDLAFRSRVSTYEVFGYVLSAVAASYLHYYGLYLIGLQGLGALLLGVRRIRALGYLILIYSLILFAYLPWLLMVLSDLIKFGTAMSRLMSWLSPPGPKDLWKYFEFLFNRSEALVIVVLALYLFLLLRSTYGFLKTREHTSVRSLLLSPGMLLALWLIVPLAGSYVVSLLWSPFFLNRALIICLPAAYLLVARAITQLPLRPTAQVGLVTVAAVLLLSHLLFSMDYYTKPYKVQTREAVQFVVENDRPNSFFVMCNGASLKGYPAFKPRWEPENTSFDYYLEKQDSNRRVQATVCEAQDMATLAEVVKREDYQYVFYLQAHYKPLPERPLLNALKDEYEVVAHEKLVGAKAHLFRVS
jgi:uncharacterized membrane protein